MSTDWKPRDLTVEDVRQVLAAHGLATDEQALQTAFEAAETEYSQDKDAVYSYAYLESPEGQTFAILHDVEANLQGYEIIPGDAPQKFPI